MRGDLLQLLLLGRLFLRVIAMVQLQQALEYFAAGLVADCETQTLVIGKEVYGMEAMAEGDFCPDVRWEHCNINVTETSRNTVQAVAGVSEEFSSAAFGAADDPRDVSR